MNETIEKKIERVIHHGNAEMKTVAQIAADIAAMVEVHFEEERERNDMSNCVPGGGCC